MDMLCLMHESPRRGYLQHMTGQPITPDQLARISGEALGVVLPLLQELEDSGVFSRTEHGVIYSRRIVKDEKRRKDQAKDGHSGGNPKLMKNYNRPGYVYAIRRESDGATKVGIALNPTNRLYKIRQQHRGDDVSLVNAWFVQDMGGEEARVHGLFQQKKVIGEWFSLTEDDIKSIELTLKGENKGKQTPSSSSSASSSSAHLKNRASAGPPPVDKSASPPGNGEKPYEIKTPGQAIVVLYKTLRGTAIDDRDWDKVHFPRNKKAAEELLTLCGGNQDKAASVLQSVAGYFDRKRLDWTMETVVSRASDFLAGRLK